MEVAHTVEKIKYGAKDKEWMIREERVKRQIFNIDSAKRCNRLNNDDDGAEWNYVNSEALLQSHKYYTEHARVAVA